MKKDDLNTLERLYWLRDKLTYKLKNDPEFHDEEWIEDIKKRILVLERKMKLDEIEGR